jgi:hypothetical protein
MRTPALAAFRLAVVASVLVVGPAAGQPPQRLSDAEFWEFFTTMSEAGGSFLSENFVSNEMSFQEVIPTLQRTITPAGVYLGVGPEQNFTYIANLKPRMAVIFDIRRQNAMHHLMYKALFELAPTRAEFVARLFSRPAVTRFASTPGMRVAALFDSAAASMRSDSAYRANWDAMVDLLVERHRFALSADDRASIEHVYRVFFDAGPNVNYGYRPGMMSFRSSYPSYGMVQSATNGDGAEMAFLASEENYRAVRDMQLRNLIVPVVGDFAGPKAIRAVGEYLANRRMTVTTFYLSNVEQYLYREQGAAERFHQNVAALPTDSTSTFIRSVPRTGRGGGMMTFASGAGLGSTSWNGSTVSITITDSAGVRVLRTIQDSAGVATARVMRDSAGVWVSRPDSARVGAVRQDSLLMSTLRAFGVAIDSARGGQITPRPFSGPPMTLSMAGQLASGLASIRATLDAAAAGRMTTYQDAIAMTKTSGWNNR